MSEYCPAKAAGRLTWPEHTHKSPNSTSSSLAPRTPPLVRLMVCEIGAGGDLRVSLLAYLAGRMARQRFAVALYGCTVAVTVMTPSTEVRPISMSPSAVPVNPHKTACCGAC